MKTICVFLATGFEEIEALTPVDVLRRANLPVKTVSITGNLTVMGAHGIPVTADALIEDVNIDDIERIILPGGMPGATNLDTHPLIDQWVNLFAEAGKPISAICAAPLVLGKRNILNNRKATCYPGFETYLQGATYTAACVEKDGNIITGKGPGAAMDFAFAIMAEYCSAQQVAEQRAGMMIV